MTSSKSSSSHSKTDHSNLSIDSKDNNKEGSSSLVSEKSRKRRKRRDSSSGSSTSSRSSRDNNSSSNSSSENEEKHRKQRKLAKKEKKRRRKEKKKQKKAEKKLKKKQKATKKVVADCTDKKTEKEIPKNKSPDHVEDRLLKDISDQVLEKAKAMAPMTKEEWEKRQSVVRKVYDEETGRHRLVKGDGEILEEIVSRERHKQINRHATQGDGEYFQSQLNLTK